MQPNEFCYWLRGYFNLSGAKSLDAKQSALVLSTLQQVKYGASASPDAHASFCQWLEGVFDAKDETKDLTPANVEKIIDRLAQVFGFAPPSASRPDRPKGERGGIVAMC